MTTVRIPPVYMKTRSLLCSCVQLNVHSDCLVYNNTKRLLQYFITSTCPLQRVQTRSLSHLTSHSRDGSHLGSQDPNTIHFKQPPTPYLLQVRHVSNCQKSIASHAHQPWWEKGKIIAVRAALGWCEIPSLGQAQ